MLKQARDEGIVRSTVKCHLSSVPKLNSVSSKGLVWSDALVALDRPNEDKQRLQVAGFGVELS